MITNIFFYCTTTTTTTSFNLRELVFSYDRHPGDAREGKVFPEVRVVAKTRQNAAIRGVSADPGFFIVGIPRRAPLWAPRIGLRLGEF